MPHRLEDVKDAAQFEQLCCDLWASMDREHSWSLFGRSGQDQKGIDVKGEAPGRPWVGIQCKVRQQFLRSTVTAKHIDQWVQDALDGELPMSKLVIATTAASNTHVDLHVKKLSDANVKAGRYPIEYWSWDRIEAALFEPQDEHVLTKYFAQYGFRSELRERVAEWLDQQMGDLQKLPLQYLRDDADVGVADPVLAQVYTMLDVTSTVDALGPTTASTEDKAGPGVTRWTLPHDPDEVGELVGRLVSEKNEENEGRRPATILEAAAVNARLLVTGVGGSGKSTFARYLTLCLAGATLRDVGREAVAGLEELTQRDPSRWRHGLLVPLWVELGEFGKSEHFPARSDKATAAALWHYLGARQNGPVSDTLRGDLKRLMQRGPVPGVLLVLDGLDELPERDKKTKLLFEVLGAFLRDHPQCRVLLTARAYAVEDRTTTQALRELQFQAVELAAPTDAVIDAFVTAWFGHDGEHKAHEVLAGLRSRPELRAIVRTPLLLTLIAVLYKAAAKNWRNVADVLDSAVARLVDHWNQGRGVAGAAQLAPHVDTIRRALEDLAFRVQCTGANDAQGDRWFERDLLVQVLEQHFGTKLPVLEVRDYLHQRCGILEFRDPKFRFPHNNVREFLAACHAERSADRPLPLLDVASKHFDDWREVVLFASALGARGRQVGVFTLLDYLVPELPAVGEDELAVDDARWKQIGLAARVVAARELWRPERAQDRGKVERLRQWAKHCVRVGALEPPDRALVARVLGKLGDDRPGVGLRSDGLPDIDWVTIRVDGNQAFAIARYPVTNAQFDAFVRDGGYTDRWSACWTDEGRAWRARNPRPVELSEPFSVPNHPRVHVTLHEAVAFAAWLGTKLGLPAGSVRVPTNDEWHIAACGRENWQWAWGNEYGDGKRSNGDDAGIGATCAVGIFPRGATPDFGLHDLSGNVLDWARRADDLEGRRWGSLRGGSWAGGAGNLRAAIGNGGGAGARGVSLGFRLAAPAST